jgi:uracil-DNA glycosylase
MMPHEPIKHWNEGRFFLQSRALDALGALAQNDLLNRCLPTRPDIFKAFELLHPQQVRVVLLGQDPYPNAADAMGLAFSSPAPRLPASLRNIFKELATDLKQPPPATGDLSHWVAQGVLLANTALTVDQEGRSHFSYWAEFTRSWIQTLAGSHSIVWILWGKHAQSWKVTILESGKAGRLEHAILESSHPNPLSAHRGFFGSKPFSRTNAELRRFGYAEIQW